MTDETDRAILTSAQQGEPKALDQLAGRWWARMWSWARAVVPSDRDAEDAAQNAWIRVQRNLHQVDPERPFGAWLKTVTRNAARDVRGAAARHPSTDLSESLPFPGDDPEIQTANRRAVGRALLAFEKLPKRQHQIIQLVDVDGLTPTEAAQRLSISASAARASLAYARRTVRAHLLENLP